MATTTPEVQAARYSFRAAEVAGHAAGCAVSWGIGHCSCPGRTALVGRAEAKRLGYVEDERRRDLFAIDPDARAWIHSRTASGEVT